MAENPIEPEPGTAPAPAPRRTASRRAPKLDAVLAAAVDSAREGVLTIAPAEQIGAHAGATAEGERLVLHRFEARLPGYRGWQWFATVARVPRGKAATVCEVGLLPSADALLAPEWVPWADRVRPEDVPQPEPAGDAAGTAESRPAGESGEPPHGDDVAAAALDPDRHGVPEEAGSTGLRPAGEGVEPPHGDDVRAAALGQEQDQAGPV